MSLAVLADHMASKGRNGDTMLVHMAPEEVRGLHALAAAHGGELTINPETGLPEANFLKKLLPTIIGFGISVASGGTIDPMTAAAIVGGVETVRTGDLSRGISAGLGAYGGASFGAGLSTTGSSALAGSPEALAAGQAAAGSITPEMIAANNAALADAGMGASVTEASLREAAANEAARNYASNLGVSDKISAGLKGLTEKSGRDAFMESMGGGKGLFKAGYMAAAPMLAADAVKANMPQTTTPMARITPYAALGGRGGDYSLTGLGSYTPEEFIRLGGFQGLRERVARGELTPPPPPGAAGGGLMDMYPGMLDFAQRSEPVVRMASGGVPGYARGGFRALEADGDVPIFEDYGVDQSAFAPLFSPAPAPAPAPAPTPTFIAAPAPDAGLAALAAPVVAAPAPAPTVIAAPAPTPAVVAAPAPAAGLGALVGATAPAATSVVTSSGVVVPTTKMDFAAGAEVLPNYLGLNAVAAGQPSAVVSTKAGPGYDYSAAALKDDTEKAVNAIYNRVLGRQAEQSGLDYWANAVRSGTLSLTDVEKRIRQIGENIGVSVDPTQLATPTAAQLAEQQRILKDPQAAALAAVRSGIAAGMTDQQIANMVNQQYGKTFSAENVADFMAANSLTRPTKPQVPVIPVTPPPTLFPGTTPGVVTTGEPFKPTVQTMEQVRSDYVKGGGRTDMPTITNILPTDRTYTYNQAFGLLQDYLKANPNALYSDVVAFARSKGIPDMQAKAAYNEFRFSGLTGASQRAYDYLMGRAPYQAGRPEGSPPISRSYAEAMGITGGYQNIKPISFTQDQSAVASGVPKEVPTVKDPKGNRYSDFVSFYFDANPDVKEAYETKVKDMTPEDYVQFHYREFGSKPSEKRKGYYDQLIAKPATYEGGGGASGGVAQDIPRMARGGLSSLAALGGAAGGGQFDLGSYSDGGRLLRGPGDGVSDSIPATIGNKRPARLADGEFVVPARIVSELGNGSTEAGARKLYAMMDRVQAARRGSIGKGKVAKNTKADKHLPA